MSTGASKSSSSLLSSTCAGGAGALFLGSGGLGGGRG